MNDIGRQIIYFIINFLFVRKMYVKYARYVL